MPSFRRPSIHFAMRNEEIAEENRDLGKEMIVIFGP